MGRQPCCDKVGMKKGPWTDDEDRKLITFILTNGISCWRTLPKLAGLMRCGKSCRLRWINYLRPDLRRGLLSEYEENMVINLHSQLGNKWSKIASHLPGRTDNEIKNHWNTRIKKKLRKNGIDPVTHTPLAPTEKSQQHENQNSSNMDQNTQNEKCTDSITIQQDEMQSMLEAPTLEVMNNGFCTDEVPLIESHEILFSDSSVQYNSSSSTTTTSSNTTIDSLLEDLEFLSTSDWLNGVDSTTNNIGFSWDMDDDFSNSNFLINDIGYGRYNPPTVNDFYDFSTLVLGEEH